MTTTSDDKHTPDMASVTPEPTPRQGGSQTSLREANGDAVLRVLRSGPATQAEVARTTGLSGATVSTITRELLAAGTLEAVEQAGGRGQQVRLALRSGVVAALAFGSRRALVSVSDLTGTELGATEVPLDPTDAALAALDRGLDAIDALRQALPGPAPLVSVGVGLPTAVRRGGTVDDAAGHRRWHHTEAADHVRARLGTGTHVHVDNDANLGARAEARWGALQGQRVGAWVKASTGIGVGLLLDGAVHRGTKGTAGELGHVSLAVDGPLCTCGNRGCLETYAGGRALRAAYAEVTGSRVSTLELASLARAGDPVARRLVDEAGARIGTALASLATLLDPALVVLGGDLAAAGDVLLEPLRAALHRRGMPAVVAGLDVVTTPLGDRAEVLGALALALDHAQPLRLPVPEESRR